MDDGGSRSGERETPWVFRQTGTDTSKLISVLMMPMRGSQVFKKLGLETDAAEALKQRDRDQKKAARDVSSSSHLFAELRAKLTEQEKEAQADDVEENETAAADEEAGAEMDDDVRAESSKKKRKPPPTTSASAATGKKALLKSLGSGYSAEEKKLSSTVQTSIDGQDQRPKTVLDDFLCAIQFVMKQIRAESDEAWAKAGLPAKTVKDIQCGATAVKLCSAHEVK